MGDVKSSFSFYYSSVDFIFSTAAFLLIFNDSKVTGHIKNYTLDPKSQSAKYIKDPDYISRGGERVFVEVSPLLHTYLAWLYN